MSLFSDSPGSLQLNVTGSVRRNFLEVLGSARSRTMVCALVPQVGRPNSVISLFHAHPAQGGLSHPLGDTEALGCGEFQGDWAGVQPGLWSWVEKEKKAWRHASQGQRSGERGTPRSFDFQPGQGQRRAGCMGTERIKSFLRADCFDAQSQVPAYSIRVPRPQATQPPWLNTLGWTAPTILGSPTFS